VPVSEFPESSLTAQFMSRVRLKGELFLCKVVLVRSGLAPFSLHIGQEHESLPLAAQKATSKSRCEREQARFS
jgi:hypothetical protein